MSTEFAVSSIINDEDTLDGGTPLHWLRRIATPREVAQTAVFLASDASSFTTGAVMVVDGGVTSKCY